MISSLLLGIIHFKDFCCSNDIFCEYESIDSMLKDLQKKMKKDEQKGQKGLGLINKYPVAMIMNKCLILEKFDNNMLDMSLKNLFGFHQIGFKKVKIIYYRHVWFSYTLEGTLDSKVEMD